ncbi:MAG: hypothetical protein CBD88_00920 [Flavobacteriales bacterium TMED228]|nr:MAG: hypothetical protein CBD88_00920 [Flavobacteriales bacterium TMED228]|tara:strand:- start:1147 stop:1374 length:228 start_codon:yes stop_codon:yes gene_type:complete
MDINTFELSVIDLRQRKDATINHKLFNINMVRIVTEDYNEKDNQTWGKESVCHIKDIRTDEDGYMYILVDTDKFD